MAGQGRAGHGRQAGGEVGRRGEVDVDGQVADVAGGIASLEYLPGLVGLHQDVIGAAVSWPLRPTGRLTVWELLVTAACRQPAAVRNVSSSVALELSVASGERYTASVQLLAAVGPLPVLFTVQATFIGWPENSWAAAWILLTVATPAGG